MSVPVPEPDDPTPIDPVSDPPIDPQTDDGTERAGTLGSRRIMRITEISENICGS
jgi:hypothetical protein